MALLITKKCINCDMCEPECPINAIYPEDDVPAGQEPPTELQVTDLVVGDVLVLRPGERAATDGHSQGTLFINPGGPGDSGVSFAERASNAFSPDLLEAYDIIGFDPRGVGSSTAITCSSDDDSSSGTAEPSASAEATASPSASSASSPPSLM